jgi:hypothetical protein
MAEGGAVTSLQVLSIELNMHSTLQYRFLPESTQLYIISLLVLVTAQHCMQLPAHVAAQSSPTPCE